MDTAVVSDELKTGLEDLVKAARILEIHGHSDRIWGHVAMRDTEGRGFWIKRHAISLGEVYDPSDFQLVSFEGKLIHGKGRRHSEWPIHGEVFLARPDINFTAHTHSFHAAIFSSIPEPLRQVRGGAPVLPARYEGSSELITTRERAREMAEVLGDAYCVFLRNHGTVFCGPTALTMVKEGIELEETCRMTLAANGSNYHWKWPNDDEWERKNTHYAGSVRTSPLWDHYCRLVERAEQQGDIRLSRGPIPVD